MASLPLYRRKARRRRIGPEASLQITVCQHLRLTGAANMIWFHPCNEGKRSEAAGAHLKRMGMLPGVADLVIVLPGRTCFLELKARGEGQSPEQIAFEALCRDLGFAYAVADNIDAALAILRSWGAIGRRAESRAEAA